MDDHKVIVSQPTRLNVVKYEISLFSLYATCTGTYPSAGKNFVTKQVGISSSNP